MILSGVDINATVSSPIKYYQIHKYYVLPFYVVAGSSALHLSVASDSKTIVKLLLKHGVDLQATDAHGLTPLHRCITHHRKRTGKLLMRLTRLKDKTVEGIGLSYLHVASHLGDTKTVARLLDAGTDIDGTIKFCYAEKNDYYEEDPYSESSAKIAYIFLQHDSQKTPLHYALSRMQYRTAELLIKRGADLLAECQLLSKRSTPVYDIIMYEKCDKLLLQLVLSILKSNRDLCDRMKQKVGMTMLHVGCYVGDVDIVRNCLNDGEDINAKIHLDIAGYYSGFTPLHVLVDEQRNEAVGDQIFQILMDNGADVAIADAKCNTPIHACHSRFDACPWVNAMFERYCDFSKNLIGWDGISLLQIACIEKNIVAVEKFLKHGVDVHTTVDYLSYDGGITALHAAARQSPNFEVVDLLLQKGANVLAKDRKGETPLHKAVLSTDSERLKLVERLVEAGADIKATNLWFKTPFEILLYSKSVTAEEIKFFLERGCQINYSNSLTKISIVSKIFEKHYNIIPESIFQPLVHAFRNKELDCMGRSVLHNIIATRSPSRDNYEQFLNRFLQEACDVDSQDNQGSTALHLAVTLFNEQGVSALLSAGADINILDSNNKTAYAYAVDSYDGRSSYAIPLPFVSHTLKLQLSEIFVNKINSQLQDQLRNQTLWKFVNYSDMKSIFDKTKDVMIGLSSITIWDVLSETGVVAAYPMMLLHHRHFLDSFYENVNTNPLLEEFTDVKCLLKLQYRKALQRRSLINSAKEQIITLIQFWMPELCRQALLRFLSNEDLKNLIASVNELKC